MNSVFAVAGFILLTGVLMVLPLLPALTELHSKSDALPLNVIQQHTGEIRFFADGFRSYMKGLEPALRECASSGEHVTGTMPDGSEYLVLGRGEEALFLPLRERNEFRPVVIAAGSDLLLPSGTDFSKDIYSAGNVIGGTKNHYRAILAEKQIRLGRESSVTRWVHAVGEFSADPACRLYGRVSSDTGIRLSEECSFLRLNAPYIAIGPEASAAQDAQRHVAVAPTHQRLFHEGDFEIRTGEVFLGNLVVRGRLRIGAGALIRGSVKSEKELTLEPRASVEGSLISASVMQIGADCRISGPIIAERSVLIRKGTRCGTLENPTTVSAPDIQVEPSVVVFGTLWARDQGQVVASL
ncbi:MAG: polymer-forming cytoskeletal protein [Terriglobales bacterium]